ncbi:CLUMA_CG003380, isoform A [Clunio marinus]|uniref:CLUMA_CG003380, isoform A n=1 Tax=Clunio marinus TaxID=568069 RepID=A0A1J1HP77_9DIPT|nr:CLUMA_CG003380, isoform A [Clunio marinus]
MEQKHKTVLELPEEITVKIFEMLEIKALEAASLTCKSWYDISSRMSWHLKLQYEQCNNSWIETLTKSNRKFTSIKLNQILPWEAIKMVDGLSNFLEKHGENIKVLDVNFCTFDDLTVLCKILNGLPNLKTVLHQTTSIQSKYSANIPEHDLPQLQSLKTLDMSNCGYELLQPFRKSQLHKLKILESYSGEIGDPLLLWQFLMNQRKLKCFEFKSMKKPISPIFVYRINVQFLPFKLKSLALLNLTDHELINYTNYYNNALDLLLSQSDTLEDLELGEYVPDFFYHFAISNLNRLSSLSVDGEDIPQDPSFYNFAAINPSVKKLTISNPFANDALRNFYRLVPNLETLIISKGTFDNIASSMFPNLKHLEIPYTHEEFINDVKFPKMETIFVGDLHLSVPWATFKLNNPNVRKIEINNYEDCNESFEI